MAKVIIMIDDDRHGPGQLGAGFEFDPPLQRDQEKTPAQTLGSQIAAAFIRGGGELTDLDGD